MSRYARDLYRKRLGRLLVAAPDEGFLELIWATNALQSGHEAAAIKVLSDSYPAEAATKDMTSKYAIHKWELETLANEMLTTPKHTIRRADQTKSLNCRNFASVAAAVNFLRKLENHEYNAASKPEDILKEMYRISGRQFDWQRGYFNIPSFYRSAFIYGQGYCAEYMSATYGTSLAEMSLVGFAIHTATSEYPALAPDISVEAVGLTVESLQRVLALISRPIDELRKLATEQRAAWQITAYRPSVLRRFPCISFHGGKRFLCPLPDLIIERVTSGVFYDVIDGGGEIRHEYGRRFEEYVFLYMQGQLPKMGAKREWSYRFQQQNIDTPDIVVLNDDYLVAAIECKASRMSFAARFSEEAVLERG